MTLDVKSIPQIILKQTYKSKQKKYKCEEKLHIYRRDTFCTKMLHYFAESGIFLNVNKI